MSFFIRSRVDFLALAYARVGLPAPAVDAPVEYLRLDRRWNEQLRRRVERADWVTDRAAAFAFDSEADAWTAFDRTGYCRRDYFEAVEL